MVVAAKSFEQEGCLLAAYLVKNQSCDVAHWQYLVVVAPPIDVLLQLVEQRHLEEVLLQ